MSYLQAVLKNIPEEDLQKINESHERKMKEQQENKEKKVRELKINKSSNKKSFDKSNKPTNKNSLRRQENDEPKKVEREETFFEALKQAQKELVNMCMLDNVDTNSSKINLGEDAMVISVEGKDYTFSKDKILKSKTFKNELTKSYNDSNKNVYLTLSVSKDKDSTLLSIKAVENTKTYLTKDTIN
jgi:hypothetical protein